MASLHLNTHDTWRPCCLNRVSNGSQKETKIIIALTTLPPWWVWYVIVSLQWQLQQCSQNLCRPSWEQYCQQTLKQGARAMVVNRNTKALITPPPRWVSATKFNVLVSTRERSRRYSQNLCRTLLVKRYLFICIIYASQFFPYQECNNVPYHLIQYTTSALIRTCRAYLPHRTYSWVYITSSDQTMSAGTTYHGYLRLHSKLLAYACQQTM